MFTHLKYLAGLSLIILILGAVFVGVQANRFKEHELLVEASRHAEASVAGFGNTVWERYAPVLLANANSPYLGAFQQESKRYFEPQQMTKITIFSPDVRTLYYGSSDERVTTDGSTPVTLFGMEKLNKGIPVSRFLKNVQLANSSAPTIKRSMVQSIIPITRDGNTMPDVLIEIYTDTTLEWSAISDWLRLFLSAMIGIFAVLLIVLLVTARRAEFIITKQHEVNLELIATATRAEAQSRDKSQFLASVSHELRTPLNAIIGFSEIIRTEAKDKLEKIYQEYIDDIHASGKHLLSLINDILDFSKAEAGKLQIEWAETDITKVISNSLRMVMPRAETAQVTLVEETSSSGHLVIVTDPKKLKQVLLNLLSNAVKFTPAGGEVRVHSWTQAGTGALVMEVRDTGIGIAPKDISRVMTPFGQVDSALSRKYEGTGLGLPLSKKFIESMGGTFNIESEAKVGTIVRLTIPKAPPGWGTAAMQEHRPEASNDDVPSESDPT